MQRISIVMITLGCLCGCTAPHAPLSVYDSDPSIKIPAIKVAVDQKDLGTVRQLVNDLDSDDPAVRFYSIEGLERLTGQTLDYQYYDNAADRKPAIQRWQAWLNTHEAASVPATNPSVAGRP